MVNKKRFDLDIANAEDRVVFQWIYQLHIFSSSIPHHLFVNKSYQPFRHPQPLQKEAIGLIERAKLTIKSGFPYQ
jgi:hypothetical protein